MQIIGESTFTVGWLLKALEKRDATYVKLAEKSPVSQVRSADISGGQGFGSNVYQCLISFENEETYSVMLKVPRADKIAEESKQHDDADLAIAYDVHNRECYFYENFAPLLQIPLPKVYATREWYGKDEGCILMENMGRFASTAKIQHGFGREEIMAIAGYLAKLQAHFLCEPNEEWKEKFNGDVFNTVHANRFFSDILDMFLQKNPDHSVAVMVMKSLIKRQKSLDYVFTVHAREIGLPVSFVHGDLWTHNVMWKVDDEGKPTTELGAILDWQMIHSGSPTFDLARFMAISVDSDVRRELEPEALAHFHRTLLSELQKRDNIIEIKMNHLTEAYKINFIHQALHIVGLVEFFPDARDVLEKRATAALADVLKILRYMPFEVTDRILVDN